MANPDKDNFLYPKPTFQGETTLPNLMFDANLQEFSQRVGMICALENGGKITTEEAYHEIKVLWKKLKESKVNILGSGEGG